MLVVANEVRDPFIKNLSASDLAKVRFGPGAFEKIERHARRANKECRQAQRGSTVHGDQWRLHMRIPAYIYFAMEDSMPGCWDPDKERQTWAWLWDNFEDFRASPERSNPYRCSPHTPSSVSSSLLSVSPSPASSDGPTKTEASKE